MSISESMRMAAAVFCLLAGTMACAAAATDCPRCSACASGLTCAAGRCVVPPSSGDAPPPATATSAVDATSSPGDDESDTDATTDEPDDDASTE